MARKLQEKCEVIPTISYINMDITLLSMTALINL